MVEKRFEVIRPPVAIIDVVGVLPHVAAEDRLGAVHERVLAVRCLADNDLAVLDCEPAPPGAELRSAGLGKFFPFYVTAVELRCSEDVPEKFHLFRVFDFGRSPKLYTLRGSLRDTCSLEPTLYRATR